MMSKLPGSRILSIVAFILVESCNCGRPACPPPQVGLALGKAVGPIFNNPPVGLGLSLGGELAQAAPLLDGFNRPATSADGGVYAVQFSLNGRCFTGDQGGFGVSLEPFVEDLTDVQCRPELNDFDGGLNGGVPTELALLGAPYSLSCTPATLYCTDGGPSGGCMAGVAPAAGACHACEPGVQAGDPMGNPTGTFVAFQSAGGEIFARFPDAVSTPSLSSGLVDLIGYSLFGAKSSRDPNGQPALVQSYTSCGHSLGGPSDAGACGGGSSMPSFDYVSGWLRNGDPNAGQLTRLEPVVLLGGSSASAVCLPFSQAPFSSFPDAGSCGVLLGGSTIDVSGTPAGGGTLASHLVYLRLFLDEIHAEGLLLPTGGAVSLEGSIDVRALLQIQALPPVGGCVNRLLLSAPAISFGALEDELPIINLRGSLADVGVGDVIHASLRSLLMTGVEFDLTDFCLADASIKPESAPDPVPDPSLPAAYLDLAGTPTDAGDPPGPVEAVGLTYETAAGELDEEVAATDPFGRVAVGSVTEPLLPVTDRAILSTSGQQPYGVLSAAGQYLGAATPTATYWYYPYQAFQSSGGGFVATVELEAEPLPTSDGGPMQQTSCQNPSIDWTAPLTGPVLDAGYPFAALPVLLSPDGDAGLVTPTAVIAQNGTGPELTLDICQDPAFRIFTFCGGTIDPGTLASLGVSPSLSPTDPPDAGTTLADFLAPDVVQAFSGPVTVELFETKPGRRCGRRPHGPGEEDRARKTDDPEDPDLGCGDDGTDRPDRVVDLERDPPRFLEAMPRFRPAAAPAPSAASSTAPSGNLDPPSSFLVLKNLSGLSLMLQPANQTVTGAHYAGFDGRTILRLLCGSNATSGSATFPPSMAGQCDTPCGPSGVPPGPNDCCWRSRSAFPAVLGVKSFLYDLRTDPVPGHTFASGGFAFGGEPNDPGVPYLLGPVFMKSSAASAGQRIHLGTAQPETVEIIGSTADYAGRNPADMACFIAPIGTGVRTLTPGVEKVDYLPQPGDQVVGQIAVQVPGGGGYQLLDAGVLPFERVAAIDGSQNECSFLSQAMNTGFGLQGEQPAVSAPFGHDPSSVVGVALTSIADGGALSACYSPVARVDAVGVYGGELVPEGQRVLAGNQAALDYARATGTPLLLESHLNSNGLTGWTSVGSPSPDGGAFFFLSSSGLAGPYWGQVGQIVDGGIPFDDQGNLQSAATCPASLE